MLEQIKTKTGGFFPFERKSQRKEISLTYLQKDISASLLLFLFSCPVMSDSFATPWIGIFQARILEWVAISFLQRIFLTQGSNPHLLHYR